MERDATIVHGAREFLRDRMCYVSDAYTTVWCKKCGMIALSSIFGVSCKPCGIDKATDPQNFARCTIPRAYNYFLHLLAGFGIKLASRFRDQPEIENRYISKSVNK